jgi:adenylate cyclase
MQSGDLRSLPLMRAMFNKDTKKPPKEIERKFLVEKLPPSDLLAESTPILQGYIFVGSDGSEIRVRQKGDRCMQTLKRGVGLCREEIEVELTRDQFIAMWPWTEGRRVEKERFTIPYHRHTIELDLFHGDLEELVIAEVEFESVAASEHFTPPNWFGEEVTGDPRYLNQTLALLGKPDRK